MASSPKPIGLRSHAHQHPSFHFGAFRVCKGHSYLGVKGRFGWCNTKGKIGEWRETLIKHETNDCCKTNRLAGKCAFSCISCSGPVPPPHALKAKRANGVRHPTKTAETNATKPTVWTESVCFHAFRALVLYPPTGFEGKTGDWRETSTKNDRKNCYTTNRLAGKCVFSRISCFGPVPPHRL
jgi:hypothetical protein